MIDWLGYQLVMLMPQPRGFSQRNDPYIRLYCWALRHAGAWAYR